MNQWEAPAIETQFWGCWNYVAFEIKQKRTPQKRNCCLPFFLLQQSMGKLDKTMLGILIQKRWLLEVALAFRDLLSRRKIFWRDSGHYLPAWNNSRPSLKFVFFFEGMGRFFGYNIFIWFVIKLSNFRSWYLYLYHVPQRPQRRSTLDIFLSVYLLNI